MYESSIPLELSLDLKRIPVNMAKCRNDFTSPKIIAMFKPSSHRNSSRNKTYDYGKGHRLV
jgi:hypothetical protein